MSDLFRFRAHWTLAVSPERVWAVLERVEEYPQWWPQVRRVRLDPGGRSGTAEFRSALPYAIRLGVSVRRHDPEARVLDLALTGDLDGWARWTLREEDGVTLVRYAQEVRVVRPLLRALARPARPLLVLNHTLMMRAGRRGLARRLGAV
ncbi:SRPBCC family protein [Streptomyces sp. BI20]|uniref:SRPBCC family protein n=1 Tax=Streptomyces sp. BI20 TaxID=3403460 RepID=UPI003C771EE9